jgi:hypothetical protein
MSAAMGMGSRGGAGRAEKTGIIFQGLSLRPLRLCERQGLIL